MPVPHRFMALRCPPRHWPTARRFYNAPVAQPDRVVASEAIGRGFESLRARHFSFIACTQRPNWAMLRCREESGSPAAEARAMVAMHPARHQERQGMNVAERCSQPAASLTTMEYSSPALDWPGRNTPSPSNKTLCCSPCPIDSPIAPGVISSRITL